MCKAQDPTKSCKKIGAIQEVYLTGLDIRKEDNPLLKQIKEDKAKSEVEDRKDYFVVKNYRV